MSMTEMPEMNRLGGSEVLVVSQHFVRRGMTSLILRQSGVVVTEATNPGEANEALQCHVFEAVIADVIGLREEQRQALESAFLLRHGARLYLIAQQDDIDVSLPGLSVDAILKPEIDRQEILCTVVHADAAVPPNA